MSKELKRQNFEKYKVQILLGIPAILYFIVLHKFYAIDYYVPDNRAYFEMGQNGPIAVDGFSSLFILIATNIGACQKQLNYICLSLIAIALYNMSFFFQRFLKENKKTICAIIFLYSSGIWYYIYGKILYDFPFTAFTYSICLLFAQRTYVKKRTKDVIYTAFFVGLLLSWKTYNVFPVFGFFLLTICNSDTRKTFIDICKKTINVIMAILMLFVGYVAGNFTLLYKFKETISGICAYPASYNAKDFFFLKTRVIWDHVSDLPFNMSVCSMGVVVGILVILPVICKKIQYAVVSIIMFLLLLVYVEKFSPGFAWHGFPFGLYVITAVCFIIHEVNFYEKIYIKSILVLCLLTQIANNFGVYLPKQVEWSCKTIYAEQVFEDSESEILQKTSDIIASLGNETYYIDTAIKRYKPVALYENSRKKVTLYSRQGYYFLDPLEYVDYQGWTKLKTNENYSVEGEYVIWIVPNVFFTMGDVVDIHLYDGYEKIDFVSGKGYTIYLLQNKNQM